MECSRSRLRIRTSYHVESVGRQGEGMGEETADELEEEEARVDRDHNLDARRLGHQHLGAPHGEEAARRRWAQKASRAGWSVDGTGSPSDAMVGRERRGVSI